MQTRPSEAIKNPLYPISIVQLNEITPESNSCGIIAIGFHPENTFPSREILSAPQVWLTRMEMNIKLNLNF